LFILKRRKIQGGKPKWLRPVRSINRQWKETEWFEKEMNRGKAFEP
jgi:hypothetical protein